MTVDPTLEIVRDRVRNTLASSAAFRALPPAQRRDLAHDMVKVARYIVDANGETAGVPMAATVSTGLDTPPPPVAGAAAVDRRTAGRDFADQGGAVAARSGSAALTNTIQRVNFPRFVAGLVDGVFNAIVTSSIKQMEAYSTLVANVAKSVDEYMNDNISKNQARDYLASKYPQHLKVETKGKDGPRLVPAKAGAARGGHGGARGMAVAEAAAADKSPLPDFMKDLGLPEPVSKLDPKTAEEKLVPAARKRMAMDRQQMLATMVLMGINRLIVTDGKISASCLFTLDTTDTATADADEATTFDQHTEEEQKGWSFLVWESPKKSRTADFSVETTSTVSSSAEVNMHAQLSGNVDINFRSETFPLEKMADMLQIQQIEQKAPAAAATPPPPAAPPIQLPPPPALPAIPGMPGAAAPAPAAQPASPAAPAPGAGT